MQNILIYDDIRFFERNLKMQMILDILKFSCVNNLWISVCEKSL